MSNKFAGSSYEAITDTTIELLIIKNDLKMLYSR